MAYFSQTVHHRKIGKYQNKDILPGMTSLIKLLRFVCRKLGTGHKNSTQGHVIERMINKKEFLYTYTVIS
jgi:hypothetical protein